MQTLARWVTLPENRAARCAVDRVVDYVCGAAPHQPESINPLFLHGPSGSGKTHLVSALLAEVSGRRPSIQLAVLQAGELELLARAEDTARPELTDELGADLASARRADLLVVEDLQHLPGHRPDHKHGKDGKGDRAVEVLVRLVDRCLSGGRQLICTASTGPAQLDHLPARLTSRLAQGVVTGLTPLGPVSRLAFLRDKARERPPLPEGVLAWLAEHIAGSVRQLEGAWVRLEALVRLHQQTRGTGGRSLTLDEVAEHFRTDAEASRPTVERIAQRVSRYYQLEPQQLRSRQRSRDAMMPRQVGMYLARQLTELSLQQIGAYFGGRDHTTVLHACRKVEQALAHDIALSGAVRQLHADLA